MKATKWQWHTWDLKYIKADFSGNLWQPMLSIIMKSIEHWQHNCISRPSSVKPPLTPMMFRKLQLVTTAQQLQIVGHWRGNSLFSFTFPVRQVLNRTTIRCTGFICPAQVLTFPSFQNDVTIVNFNGGQSNQKLRVFTWTLTLTVASQYRSCRLLLI